MENLLLYIGSVIILTLLPGPDIIFVITQGLTKGKKEAIFTALGLGTGCIFHTTIASLGIALIMLIYDDAGRNLYDYCNNNHDHSRNNFRKVKRIVTKEQKAHGYNKQIQRIRNFFTSDFVGFD